MVLLRATSASYASAGASSGGASLAGPAGAVAGAALPWAGASVAKETTKPPPVRRVYILTFFASAASRAFSACTALSAASARLAEG